MRVFLVILTVLNALASFVMFAAAKSAIHEILATVTFLVAAVLLGAQAVMGSISQMQYALAENLRELIRTVQPPPPPLAMSPTDIRRQQPPPTKICPFCAEEVKRAAIRCKHCRSDLPPDAKPA